MAAQEVDSAAAALALGYAPAAQVRVGILLVAGALSDAAATAAVGAALEAAGHTALRRCARLQPRPGESALRVADVIGFLALYGHEYALAAFRAWPEARGQEAALIAAATQAGCRTMWEVGAGDAAPAGCDIVLRRAG